ncbi:MAG: formate/nitrite transporter family protein [Anaerovoracaceae bacterium]|jgi:formate/nitrite transporter
MAQKNFLTPAEIAEFSTNVGVNKTSIPRSKSFALAILAGAFIGFAAFGSNMAAHNLLANPETFGLGRCMAGIIFTVGLVMVIVGGAELFTGNTLITTSVLNKKVTWGAMFRNWGWIWVGNLVGSVLVAYLTTHTSLCSSSANLLGAMTIKIAVGKVGLDFLPAIFLGILCNWLVCMAVWMSFSAQDVIGKMFACVFPIWLFVCSGFEHSVANMTYIPMGIFAKANSAWAEAAMAVGVTPEQLDGLNWGSMFIDNLLPVTIGNIIGGALFVATFYWFSFLRKKEA